MSDDEYYAESPYDEFEEMLWDADPAPNLADDLAQHTAYSPVWQDDPVGELDQYHSDWEYYSDDYYDDDPAILGHPPADEGSLQNLSSHRNVIERGRKRMLRTMYSTFESAENKSLKSTIQGTVWAKDLPLSTKVFHSEQNEKVALLTDWKERFRLDRIDRMPESGMQVEQDESWANDLSLADMGLLRAQESEETTRKARMYEDDISDRGQSKGEDEDQAGDDEDEDEDQDEEEQENEEDEREDEDADCDCLPLEDQEEHGEHYRSSQSAPRHDTARSTLPGVGSKLTFCSDEHSPTEAIRSRKKNRILDDRASKRRKTEQSFLLFESPKSSTESPVCTDSKGSGKKEKSTECAGQIDLDSVRSESILKTQKVTAKAKMLDISETRGTKRKASASRNQYLVGTDDAATKRARNTTHFGVDGTQPNVVTPGTNASDAKYAKASKK